MYPSNAYPYLYNGGSVGILHTFSVSGFYILTHPLLFHKLCIEVQKYKNEGMSFN